MELNLGMWFRAVPQVLGEGVLWAVTQLRNSALWIYSVANNKFVPEVIAEIF